MARLIATLLWCSSLAAGDLLGIPTVPFVKSNGSLKLSSLQHIIVDTKYCESVDTAGHTLIPTTLLDYANTFASDLETSGHHAEVVTGDQVEDGSIFLTVANSSDFVDAAGRWTSEAYGLQVSDNQITITGASSLGAWWATRSIIQQGVLHNGTISAGYGVDAPGWGTRGIMLDCGRHFYPPEFIIELCTWQSYWKQNVFHMHLSDNLYNNPNYTYEQQMELYARFRLWSDDPRVAGLNRYANESYTRQDFDHIQSACAARGVTVIPEIESPGHALVFSQWKPELGLTGSLDQLNISYPDTIGIVQTIWDVFAPWFKSKVFEIGADEYSDESLSAYETGETYNYFVKSMNEHIRSTFGRSMRIWGTFPPQSNYTDNIDTDVSIQHWEYFEDNPYYDYILNNYSVVNSDDRVYIVTKYSSSYPQSLNQTFIFEGNPEGGAWSPYIFDSTNSSNNPKRDNPYVLGHVAPQWVCLTSSLQNEFATKFFRTTLALAGIYPLLSCSPIEEVFLTCYLQNDYGANTSTYLEGYYSWRDGLPALADKQWGGKISRPEYDIVVGRLQASAPAQNLDRTIKSRSSTILKYSFNQSLPDTDKRHGGVVKDLSGNGYDGTSNCSTSSSALHIRAGCSLLIPLSSKGEDYTLSFSVKPISGTLGPIFSGKDSVLQSSKLSLDFVSGGNAFALNYSLPVGEWTQAELIRQGNRTFFRASDTLRMEFLTRVGVNGERFEWAPMALNAPVHSIGGGGWEGDIDQVELVDFARL